MKARCLVLHVGYPHSASYYDDWLDALQTHPRLTTVAINLFKRGGASYVAEALKDAELTVVLHSGTGDGLEHVTAIAPTVSDRRCPLIVFMGNEFNLPWLPISAKRSWAAQIKAEFIATQLPIEAGRWLYEGSGARILLIHDPLTSVHGHPVTHQIAEERAARDDAGEADAVGIG